jgi:hypothetical protein
MVSVWRAEARADRMPSPMPDPTTAPHLETVADRLQKLERTLADLKAADRPSTNGYLPDGLTAGPPAGGGGSLVPAAVLRAVLPAGDGGLFARVPVLNELRLMAKMYFDPRYRLSRVAQFGVPAVLALMLFSYVFFNHMFGVPFVPLVSVILERLALIVLAVALYKILAREAARYASVLNYLSRYGR